LRGGVLWRTPALSDPEQGTNVLDLFFNPSLLSLQAFQGGSEDLT
jgi:hypothetical protein